MKCLQWLLDLLYPPKCIFCRSLLPTGSEGWCAECEKKLPYFDGTVKGSYFSVCSAPLKYQDSVRDAVHRYKFGGQDSYAKAFSGFVADTVRYHHMEAELVTWVPVSAKRRRNRGYDQAELLARATAERLGLPCERLLTKTVDNKAQSGLSEAARRANVLGVYRAERPEAVSGRKILLIDDVVTTASTLGECSRVLLTAGAEKVSCAAFACTAGNTGKKQV